MEPLEIIRDIIREGKFSSVGGAPQVGKVYRNLDTRLFVVPWMVGDAITPTLAGRPLLNYETGSRWVSIDPDRPDVFTQLGESPG